LAISNSNKTKLGHKIGIGMRRYGSEMVALKENLTTKKGAKNGCVQKSVQPSKIWLNCGDF